MKKTKFRLRTKDFFMTYSQCDLGKEKIFNHLKQLMASKNQEINYLSVCLENHADNNGVHSHVFLQLKKYLDIQSGRFFDIDGKHPEIERARTVQGSVDYVKKDGDFIEEGTPKDKKYITKNENDKLKQIIYDEIDRLKNEYYHDDKLTLNQVKKSLNDFILKTDRDFYYEKIDLIKKILNERFTKKKEELEDEEEFSKPDYSFNSFKSNSKTNEIIAAIQTQLSVQSLGKRPKSIVIEGPSRLGKTEFILSYLTHINLHYNYTRGEFNFSKQSHKNAYKINIFDDISLTKIRKEGLIKDIIGGQKGFTVDVKYAPKRNISGKKLSIFLVNPDISFENYCEWSRNNGHKFHEYIEDNCIFIYIPDKLYEEINE